MKLKRILQSIGVLVTFCLLCTNGEISDGPGLRGILDEDAATEENHRELVRLTFAKNKQGYPYGRCRGPCRRKKDCRRNLICYRRKGYEKVPGCNGKGKPNIGYCVRERDILPPLKYIGKPHKVPKKFPLDACQGHCENKGQCKPGLKCMFRKSSEKVPGCFGKGKKGENYCFDPKWKKKKPKTPITTKSSSSSSGTSPTPTPATAPVTPAPTPNRTPEQTRAPTPAPTQSPTPAPSPAPTSTPTLAPTPPPSPSPTPVMPAPPPVTSSPTPVPTVPSTPETALPMLQDIVDDDPDPALGVCQGDCDSNRECAGDLLCFKRDEYEDVPGCDMTYRGIAKSDYCYDPSAATPPGTDDEPELYTFERSKFGIPFDKCQGDCDDDTECKPGLKCFRRQSTEKVPGCSGQGVSDKDYCYDPATVVPTPLPATAPLNPTPAPTAPPTSEPTPNPSPSPSLSPTPEPTLNPTPAPSPFPTGEPTAAPSPLPTQKQTEEPTVQPTKKPTVSPTPNPTPAPSQPPTEKPTAPPSPFPTGEPTAPPSPEPTQEQTEAPTVPPTKKPTVSPTPHPTDAPTPSPSSEPTAPPTQEPTLNPTPEPSSPPTNAPTAAATPGSTSRLTGNPTSPPTEVPTPSPTPMPTTSDPTTSPTTAPTEPQTTPEPTTAAVTPAPTTSSTTDSSPQPTVSAAPPQPSDGPTPSPTSASTPQATLPMLEFIGKNPDPPIPVCKGDCDGDETCAPGLLCLKRDGDEPVPGCSGVPLSRKDYCYDPNWTPPAGGPPTGTVEGELYTFERSIFGIPFSKCEGDCDEDSECNPGLLCFKRKNTEKVPGCTGVGVTGLDYCYDPDWDSSPQPTASTTNPPTTMPTTLPPATSPPTTSPTPAGTTSPPTTSPTQSPA